MGCCGSRKVDGEMESARTGGSSYGEKKTVTFASHVEEFQLVDTDDEGQQSHRGSAAGRRGARTASGNGSAARSSSGSRSRSRRRVRRRKRRKPVELSESASVDDVDVDVADSASASGGGAANGHPDASYSDEYSGDADEYDDEYDDEEEEDDSGEKRRNMRRRDSSSYPNRAFRDKK